MRQDLSPPGGWVNVMSLRGPRRVRAIFGGHYRAQPHNDIQDGEVGEQPSSSRPAGSSARKGYQPSAVAQPWLDKDRKLLLSVSTATVFILALAMPRVRFLDGPTAAFVGVG